MSPVWSEVNQTVLLTDFVSVSPIPLQDALRRALPDDPRRTPWLDGLREYYRLESGGETWSIIYFPRKHANAVFRALHRYGRKESPLPAALGGGGGVGFLWLPPLFLTLYLSARNGRFRFFPAAAALSWAPLWFAGGLSGSLAGIFGYLTLVTLGSEDEFQPGRVLGCFSWNSASRAIPPAAGFLLCAVSDTALLPGSALSSLSSFALLLALENVYRREKERTAHAVFRGIPLCTARSELLRSTELRDRTFAAFLAAAMTILLAGPLITEPASSRARLEGTPGIPSPAARVESFAGAVRKLPELVRERRQEQLPDILDAVAHRAYQESLPYSRIGTREYGSLEPVYLDRVTTEGPLVLSTRELILDFGETWIREALRDESRRGVGAVLAEQRGVYRVEKRTLSGARVPSSLASKNILFYIMLLAPSGLGLFHRKRWIGAIQGGVARSALKT